jgi:hypothetical protein
MAVVVLWFAPGAWEATAEQETLLATCDAGEPHARSVALGAHIGTPSPTSPHGAPWDPAKIDEFASMVGRQPSVVMWYQDWATPGVKEFNGAMMDEVLERGAMPVVTWEPADWTMGANQPNYTLQTIIRGDHDEYVRQWAREAAAWRKPFYLRFAHEMNGNWYPWSPLANGNGGPNEYVAAWRHVHAIFREEGATNVRWVWNPDRSFPDRPSYASLYPGDEYVDWVAIDAYNWGTLQQWSQWRTFPQLFKVSYTEMEALTDKPMMVGETASAESGGNKGAWIRQTFLTDIPTRYPQVRAVIWYHRDNRISSQADWRVDSSEDSLKAFQEVAASPLYQGRLPPSGQLELDTDIVSGPSKFTNSSFATFDLFSSQQPSKFECSLDEANFSSCTSPNDYTDLSQGAHSFQVRAIDAAGNPDATPAACTWTVDTVKPTGRITINGGLTHTSSRTVRLGLYATDPFSGSGVAQMRVKNAGSVWSAWQQYTTKKSWRLSSGTGKKMVFVEYKDRARNVSETSKDTIRYQQ